MLLGRGSADKRWEKAVIRMTVIRMTVIRMTRPTAAM
jgi:hypothetical protein